MRKRLIEFVPPVVGLDGDFNTFRLGLFYSKRLTAGEEVFLSDSKERLVIARARVLDVSTGTLSDMLRQHAATNHAMLAVRQHHEQELLILLQKFYGPHIATPNRKTTVIHLRRINGEDFPDPDA